MVVNVHNNLIPLPHRATGQLIQRFKENCEKCTRDITHKHPGRNNQNCIVCDEVLENVLEVTGSGYGSATGFDFEPKNAYIIYDHLESKHHIPIRRLLKHHNGKYVLYNGVPKEETLNESLKRFTETYPDFGGENCKCPFCAGGELLRVYKNAGTVYRIF
mgnify:CR=1 FL=1